MRARRFFISFLKVSVCVCVYAVFLLLLLLYLVGFLSCRLVRSRVAHLLLNINCHTYTRSLSSISLLFSFLLSDVVGFLLLFSTSTTIIIIIKEKDTIRTDREIKRSVFFVVDSTNKRQRVAAFTAK